jgi:kynurenine formamidase
MDDLIAARRARRGRPSSSPFGPDDEIGMLNLVTPDSVARALGAVDPRKVFDLAVDYFVGMPAWTAWGDPPFMSWMTATPDGGAIDDVTGMGAEGMRHVSRSADAMSMFIHCGTHVDALNHIGIDGVVWNCFDHRTHLGSQRWAVAGADRLPPVVARGVLVDVAGAHGVDVLEPSHAIDAAEVARVLADQGTRVRPGDVVLVRTGRMNLWPDAERFLPDEPGITRDAAELFAEAGAVMIGADNVGLERHPSPDPDNWQPVHTYLLAEAGVPILEVVNLEELAAERVHEFVFIGACLRIRGATGAPLRPIAMPMLRD